MTKHGLLEDVGAEIGFTAATALVDWFAGFGQIAIPLEAREEHPIARVIGMPAYRILVKMYEGVETTERFLWINQGENREIARRDRLIAALLVMGTLTPKQIGTIAGISESQVRYSQNRVERLGILPMLMRRVGLGKVAAKKPDAEPDDKKVLLKRAYKKPGVKPPAKAPSNCHGKKPGKTEAATIAGARRDNKVPVKRSKS